MIITLLLSVAVAFAQGTGAIKEIVIQGNQNVSREAIIVRMKTKVGQPYIQANLDQDKQAINDMVFFQAVLLAGYAYAHAANRTASGATARPRWDRGPSPSSPW